MVNQPRASQPLETRLAVLYLRTASAHQADRDMAIVVQQHVCSWRAHELGATVAGEFVDFGSGLSIERPRLTELLARLAELRAQNAETTVFVIAADHARIARSVEAYSRVSWQVDQAGAVLNIASIPLVEYEALARRSRPPTDEPYPDHKELPTNQED
jgi:hypothetical protein